LGDIGLSSLEAGIGKMVVMAGRDLLERDFLAPIVVVEDILAVWVEVEGNSTAVMGDSLDKVEAEMDILIVE
jgi:hypothetical protein